MQYYFSWVTEEEVFSPDLHLREDEKIFSLQITEEEGSIPQARITLQSPRSQNAHPLGEAPQKGSYCFVAIKTVEGNAQLLFRGRLVGFPTGIQGEMITLDFMALSAEREAKYEALCTTLKDSGSWGALFIPLSQRDNPDISDLLSTKARHVFWDRISHEVTFSDLVQGAHHDHIAGNYYRDSLQVKVLRSPLREIEVQINAKWVQSFQGATRFDHLLQGKLPQGVIETYSGRDLEKKWWHADQQFQSHGYCVLESSLKPLESLGYTAPFLVSPHDPILKNRKIPGGRESHVPQKVRFKCKSYRPRLKLGWRYQQPRHETVQFVLKNACQPLSYNPSKRQVLNLTVHDLVKGESVAHWGPDLYYKRGEAIRYQENVYQAKRSHRSSQGFLDDTVEWDDLGLAKQYPLQQHRGTFFKTDTGSAVVKQALEMARAYLCASTRCVEVSFICALEQALSWSCDHTLSLEDERLREGQAHGKITKLTFEVIGATGQSRAYVTLACAIGTGEEVLPNAAVEDSGYGDVGVLEGDTCLPWAFKEEGGRGIIYPALLGASDLLREVSVSCEATQQRGLLTRHQYPMSHNILKSLKGKATHVTLRLEDLRGHHVEKTVLRLENLQTFSAPKQMTIGV